MHALQRVTGPGALCAMLLMLAGCATPGPHQPNPTADDLRITDYPYNADVHGEDLPVEIARFDAPALHDQPENGKTIELGFLRYPAVEDAIGPPIVFLTNQNPNDAVPESLIVRLRQLGDVVIFNRRGYGFSSPPPPCLTRLNYPFDQPLTQARLTARTCAHAKACFESLRDHGFTPAMYATKEVVADLAFLTHVLETTKITLVAAGDMNQPVQMFAKQKQGKTEKVVLINLPNYGTAVAVNVDADNIIQTLIRRLEHSPVRTSYTGRSGQSIPIVIGDLDVSFLYEQSLRKSEDALATLVNAAMTAADDDYRALAELATQLRQQLGQGDSVRFLSIGEPGSCATDWPVRASQLEYAADWPQVSFSRTRDTARTADDQGAAEGIGAVQMLRIESSEIGPTAIQFIANESAILNFLATAGGKTD